MGRLSDCLLSGLAVGSVEWFACLLSRGSSVFVFFSLYSSSCKLVCLSSKSFVSLLYEMVLLFMLFFVFCFSLVCLVCLFVFSIKLSYSVHVLVSRASLTP